MKDLLLIISLVSINALRLDLSEEIDHAQIKTSTSPKPVRVYDGFTYNRECDVLKARMHEMKDIVDVFLIVEAELTQLGEHKKLYAKDCLDQLNSDQFNSTNVHRFTAPLEYLKKWGRSSWAIENVQRDFILNAFLEAGGRDDDIIIVSDADEILNPSCWQKASTSFNLKESVVNVHTKPENFFKGWFGCNNPRMWWKGPVVTSGYVAKKIGTQNIRESQRGGFCVGREKFKCDMYGVKREGITNEHGCAWQLSNFGGIEAALHKFGSNADGPGSRGENVTHEKVAHMMKECINENGAADYQHRDVGTLTYPSIPKYVSEHKEEFQSFFVV